MEKKQNLTRPTVDTEGISASISGTRETMEIGVKAVTTRLDGLSLTGQTALKLAAKAVVLDPGRQEVCEGLRVAADCFAAIFYLATGSGDTELSIGSVRVTVPATGPTSSVHAVNWQLAFHACLSATLSLDSASSGIFSQLCDSQISLRILHRGVVCSLAAG